jgi:hypothetical protein
MLVRVFGVVDVGIPLNDDFALLAVLAQFCEASPMYAGVSFHQLAADSCLIVALVAVIGEEHGAHAWHDFGTHDFRTP